jgi:UPF0176 protein
MMFTIAAFYRFVTLPDPAALQAELQAAFTEDELRGTILMATEGVNGTVAGSTDVIDRLLSLLAERVGLSRSGVKFSTADELPFGRLKLKVKPDVLPFRNAPVDATKAGIYVEPNEWNQLLSDPEVLLLDTRNLYEVEMGTFAGAIDPRIETFSDFATYVREHLDPARNRKVLYRRHPLREGVCLHAAGGLRRGLPPARRHPQIPRGGLGARECVAWRVLCIRSPARRWACRFREAIPADRPDQAIHITR